MREFPHPPPLHPGREVVLCPMLSLFLVMPILSRYQPASYLHPPTLGGKGAMDCQTIIHSLKYCYIYNTQQLSQLKICYNVINRKEQTTIKVIVLKAWILHHQLLQEGQSKHGKEINSSILKTGSSVYWPIAFIIQEDVHLCTNSFVSYSPSPVAYLILVPFNKGSAQNSIPLAETLNPRN